MCVTTMRDTGQNHAGESCHGFRLGHRGNSVNLGVNAPVTVIPGIAMSMRLEVLGEVGGGVNEGK